MSEMGRAAAKGSALGLLGGIRGLIAKRRAAKDVMEQSAKDKRRAAGDLTLANKALSDIKAGKLEFEPEKFKLSSRETDAYDMAMGRGAEDAAAQAREQALASMVGGGDARLAQNIQGDAFGQMARQDAIAGMEGRQAATQSLAARETEVGMANTEAFERQKQKEIAAAELLKTGSRADMRAAGDQFAMAKKAKKRAFADLGTDVLLGGAEPFVANMKKGGKVAAALDAARRFKTGGEFSHKTNKKAVVDEESGVKEAEFTGNEEVIVFNPEQKGTIDKFIADGDEKGLMSFLKKLFKEPQFKK